MYNGSNKCTTLVGDVDNGESNTFGCREYMGGPLNFSVNQILLENNKVLKTKQQK